MLSELVLLAIAGLVAGFVDAIAGGGGLLSLPALLWTGISPVEAIATNKLQGTMGSLTSTLNYLRHNLVSPRKLWLAILSALLGSALGASLIQILPNRMLENLIPVLLIGFALYFLFSPRVSDQPHPPRMGVSAFGLVIGFTVGFYDGFFGPGTGSFFTIAFIYLLGYSLPMATGNTKLLNFTSNIVALIVFIISGKILWIMGLVMGCGQIAGAWLGSHLAIRHGSRLIKPLLVTISILMSLKLLTGK
jgi:uncharacterized membrane protein YfcA